ncbi:MAG: hypothetical protein QG656_1792 [Candidatus Hydrogenedentes bacterium]|nr:hypothetical protein [Candidatus Hydrogenedentota bacterium]
MTNPLDEPIESFRTAADAFKVARHVLDGRPNPAADTRLDGLTQEEGHAMLDRAEEQLDKLVAFALFAAFERTLRDHLSASLTSISASSTIPEELAAKLHRFLDDGVDRWRIDDVIKLFFPPVAQQDVENAKDIRSFRNDVAHGDAPADAIPPQTAYRQLTAFLTNAGLVS